MSVAESKEYRTKTNYKRNYRTREKRNCLIEQFSVLCSMANKNSPITVKMNFSKNLLKTKRRINLVQIGEGNGLINVEEFIEQRLKENYKNDKKKGIDKKKAKRRNEIRKFYEQNHLLIDILREENYFFNSNLTKRNPRKN